MSISCFVIIIISIIIMVPKWSGMGLGSDLLPGDISQGLGKLALERSCVALGHLKVLWPLHNGHWGLWEREKEDSAEGAGLRAGWGPGSQGQGEHTWAPGISGGHVLTRRVVEATSEWGMCWDKWSMGGAGQWRTQWGYRGH